MTVSRRCVVPVESHGVQERLGQTQHRQILTAVTGDNDDDEEEDDDEEDEEDEEDEVEDGDDEDEGNQVVTCISGMA